MSRRMRRNAECWNVLVGTDAEGTMRIGLPTRGSQAFTTSSEQEAVEAIDALIGMSGEFATGLIFDPDGLPYLMASAGAIVRPRDTRESIAYRRSRGDYCAYKVTDPVAHDVVRARAIVMAVDMYSVTRERSGYERELVQHATGDDMYMSVGPERDVWGDPDFSPRPGVLQVNLMLTSAPYPEITRKEQLTLWRSLTRNMFALPFGPS